MTINTLLVLIKTIRERVNGLKSLRSQVSVKESYLYGKEEKKVIEPQYDVKKVDQKISELETWIFKADSCIKQSNASTEVKLETNVDKLLEPLQ